jgi:predicted ATPase/DNA-binding SARP family transcriptional activator
MRRLEITLLGSFQVTLDGVPVAHFGADTARALLAHLAMDPHTPHRRETLAGLLWPDQPESEARHNLSQALLRLRAAIGDRDAAPPFLLATRETIQWNPEGDYWLDVSAFEEAVGFARRHAHRRAEDCGACAERLAQAVELYRGEFLAGFALPSAPFEEWVVVERERLHRQALEALGQLAAYHEVQGAYAEAAEHARRALALEPWSEPPHRQLMRALALGGDRTAALAQYEVCCRVLREELGVEPEEETQALYGRIRDDSETRFLHATNVAENGFLDNLPSLPTPTVGRREVLSEIEHLLDGPDCRLLTLVGLGGIGKTRLAIETARRRVSGYADGACFVSLAGLSSSSGIVPAISQAIDLTLSEGGDPARQLLGYLRGKEMLIVLDNYEHLLADSDRPTAFVVQLLRTAPRVQLLVTSRERLNVHGEQVHVVQGMHYPTQDLIGLGKPIRSVLEYSAVQLFLACARRVRPGYAPSDEELETIGRLCRALGGMPLAIELAAAWTDVLSPDAIGDELEQSMSFLRSEMRDLPERHRSMAAAFDASWGMLSEEERAAFAALSVFHGGCRREAAEAVAGADLRTLSRLVHKSLVQREVKDRYAMHPLLRQYAEGKLRGHPQAWDYALDRHCTYYACWFLDKDVDRGELFSVLPEIDNLHAGWSRAVRTHRFAELRQYLDVPYLYELAGRFGEVHAALSWASEVLEEACRETDDPQAQITLAMTLFHLARATRLVGSVDEAERLLRRARSLLRSVDAHQELAWTDQEFVYAGLAGYGAEAKQLLEEGLATLRRSGNAPWIVIALNNLAELALRGGDDCAAEGYVREARQISEAVGNPRLTAAMLTTMGKVAYARGQHDVAAQYGERALALWRQVGWQQAIGFQCTLLGNAYDAAGSPSAAINYYRQAAALWQRMGWRWRRLLSGEYIGAVHSLCRLADIQYAQGNVGAARQFYSKAFRAAVDSEPAALLYALVRQGKWLAWVGHTARAAEVAALVRDHTESIPEAKQCALALLAEVKGKLSPDELAVAQERGRSMSLQTTVGELLENERE